MKDNQEMWIGTESQPFVHHQYPLECFSSSTFLITKAITFVAKHLLEFSDDLVNAHKNALRDHPEDPTEARRRLDIIAQRLQTHFSCRALLFFIVNTRSGIKKQTTQRSGRTQFLITAVWSACVALYVRARATRHGTCLRIMSQFAAPDSGVGVWGVKN